MIIGQAAGEAAAMSIRENKALQDIDTQQLTQRLQQQGAVMEYREPLPVPPSIRQLFRRQAEGASYSPEFF